ncbi:hypothetical protein Hanom_Chr07g00616211 [Helianthus anomalus]
MILLLHHHPFPASAHRRLLPRRRSMHFLHQTGAGQLDIQSFPPFPQTPMTNSMCSNISFGLAGMIPVIFAGIIPARRR